jgi:cytoskeletal protein CcmA (bactofilin family)
MMFKSEVKQSDLNGFLDDGSHLHGELRFETSFRIDGKFTGKVISEGDLIIGAGGEVDGDLRVGQVFVSGTVQGTIHASRRIQITPTGKVFADLDTPVLVVEDGAFFRGNCAMEREPKAAAAPKRLPAAKVQPARAG